MHICDWLTLPTADIESMVILHARVAGGKWWEWDDLEFPPVRVGVNRILFDSLEYNTQEYKLLSTQCHYERRQTNCTYNRYLTLQYITVISRSA